MGNTHSVETIQQSDIHSSPSKRAPQKLSKPRIGNHGSSSSTQAAGLIGSPSRTPSRTPSRNPSVSLPPSRSNSRIFSQTHSPEPSTSSPLPTDTASPTEAFPPVPPEPESQPAPPARDWKRRASLFRSKSSQDARRKDKRRQTITVSPDAGDRMSRANSMTWESQQEMDHAKRLQVDSWLVPGNRQSINYNLMSYESRRLLNLSEDLTACEENSIMSDSKFEVARFQVTQNTWKSSHPHQPAATTPEAAPTPRVSPISRAAPIPRANSDVSLYAPVRRRSMVQTPGVATRIPSASDFAASRRSSFRHSMPTTPAGGRSRLNSIEGGFMALDELVAEPEPLPELLPPPVQEPVERALTPSDMDYRPLGAMKFGSLRITNGAASPIPSPDLEASETHRAMAEQFASDDETSGKEYGNQDVEITVSLQPSSTSKVPSPVETTTSVMALPPLGANSLLSPELKVASKHTAMEDELFEDNVEVEYSAEVLTVRNDPNAKPSLEQLQADQSQKLSQGVARADSGVVTSPTTEYEPKPLSKADSGYSSNVSLRSFNTKQNARGKDQHIRVALKESGDEKPNSVAVPDVTVPAVGHINVDQVAANTDGSGSDSASSTPPPLPPKDDYLASSRNTMTITSPRHLQFFNLNASSFRWDRKASVSFEMAQASETGAATLQPAPASLAQPSDPVSETSNTPMTIGSGSQRQNKLQRFLSGSSMRGPPATHTIHPADEPVPTVPQDIQAKLDEHSGRFPMSTKRLTLRTRESKDTLKTIFSVGSFDVGQAEDRPDPSPVERTIVVRKPVAQAGEADDTPKTPKTPKTPRRLSFSIAQAAASVMPRRSIRRKPVPSSTTEKADSAGHDSADEIRDGFEASVTAIGNVGESVGKSAFDQAFMAMPQEDNAMRSNERAFTMTPQMERNMGMHLRAHGQMPSMHNDRLPSPQSHLFPESVDSFSKRKTSPPVSLHTRSGKGLRKPAPLRPKSSGEGQQRRQSLSRQNSREAIHSYPSASPGVGSLDEAFAVPPVPPMSPRRHTMLEQQTPARRQATDDKWRPTNRQSLHPNDARRSTRSMSTSMPPAHPPQLRHRASYDGYSQQYHGPIAGPIARGPPPVGQSASQSGAYYQQQLLNVEQQQWEQEDHFSPDIVQLSRSRSRSRSVHAHPNPPFRVLHSYNSPAYRNAPIWG